MTDRCIRNASDQRKPTPYKLKPMAKKPKKPKYHTDEQGHFVWDNFFVRGKQRRRKQRVTVIDGEIINDLDAWLLANADDVYLHQIERWDLIEQRRLEEEEPMDETTMKPPPLKLQLDIEELESAFEFLAKVDPDFCDDPCISFLDLTTGKVVSPDEEEEVGVLFRDANFLVLNAEIFEGLHYGSLDEFVHSLRDDPLRGRLRNAIRGKGAFRRFKDIVFGEGNVELKHRWQWFEIHRRRKRIVEWLRDENIEPDWGRDIFEAPPLPDKRADLLCAVLAFVEKATQLPGVRRIALIGSLTTPKAIPKDVDLLVEVDDATPLEPLARLKRRLSGATMATGDGCGADVFLCNSRHEYLGRICSWKQCASGFRQACEAQHCGRRTYLSDDLQNLHLDPALITAAPLELWPEIIARTEIPDDVQTLLVAPLRET